MRKTWRFLQLLLFISFMAGLHDGMKVVNLVVILVNGLMVLAGIAAEDKER